MVPLLSDKSRRRWHVVGVCLLVASSVLSVAMWLGVRGSQEDQQFQRPINPQRRSLEVSIESNGRLSARSTVTVGSEISGEILKVAVDFNDSVEQGQVVAEISSSRYLAQTRSARASLDAARSRLARARANQSQVVRELKRADKLSEHQLIAQSDVEQSQDRANEASSSLREAIADVNRLEAALDTAEYELGKTVIRSPVSGVVLERLVEPGQTVAASFETPALFRIAEDLSEMTIELAVDEADIGAIERGQRVAFRVDAYPAREFFGTIVQKRLAPTIRSNNATYPVIVAVDNAEGLLIPGMLADARVVVNRRDGVLTVPSEYLLQQENVYSIPDSEVVRSALASIGKDLFLSESEAASFKAVAANVDLSHASAHHAPDPELVSFFGTEAAANIIVLDHVSGDPSVAVQRQRLDSLTASFADFRSALAPEQSERLNQALSDLVSSREAGVLVIADSALKRESILIGLNDETATQIVYGLAESDQIALKEYSER